MNSSISAIVIARNEELMIANCLATLAWCDEVVVIDSGSSDRTVELAQLHGAKVFSINSSSLSRVRQEGADRASCDWLLYVDADERILPPLAREIMVHVETTPHNALTMIRQNMMYGKFFKYGGWQDESVTRIFRKSFFKGWHGEIHESPVDVGATVTLHTPLLHLTHRNTMDGLRKTIDWTAIEARLLNEDSAAKVSLFDIIRKGMMEFLRRYIFWKGYKDGQEGFVESVVQAINKTLLYINLWELQKKPTLEELYSAKEKEVAQDWKDAKI